MTSHTTAAFREALRTLPKSVQSRAQSAYRLFRSNPSHNSLQFKKVHATRPVYSARVTDDYRALAIVDGDDVVWFWIGKHADDDRVLKSL